MSIIDILGTDVDSKPASQLLEPQVNSYYAILVEHSVCYYYAFPMQNVDRTVRTFETMFRGIEERVMMWKKVA
jgi:hypothetical protein